MPFKGPLFKDETFSYNMMTNEPFSGDLTL